jgi:hypothetical protein
MADLEKKYKEISSQLKLKENELKNLYQEKELTGKQIEAKYQEHKLILEGLLKDLKDRKATSFNSLTTRTKKIEQLDREIGVLVETRKAQNKEIDEVKEKIIVLKQMKANVIRDMDYPDGLMKELMQELFLINKIFMINKKELKKKYKIVERELKKLERLKNTMINEKEQANQELEALFRLNGQTFNDLMQLVENNQKDNPAELIGKVNQLDTNDQKFGILFGTLETKDRELRQIDEKITKLKELKAQILGHLEYDDNLFDEMIKEITNLSVSNINPNVKNIQMLKKGLYKIN